MEEKRSKLKRASETGGKKGGSQEGWKGGTEGSRGG